MLSKCVEMYFCSIFSDFWKALFSLNILWLQVIVFDCCCNRSVSSESDSLSELNEIGIRGMI